MADPQKYRTKEDVQAHRNFELCQAGIAPVTATAIVEKLAVHLNWIPIADAVISNAAITLTKGPLGRGEGVGYFSVRSKSASMVAQDRSSTSAS